MDSKPQLSTHEQTWPCVVQGWCEKDVGCNREPPFVLLFHHPTNIRGKNCLWAYGVFCQVVTDGKPRGGGRAAGLLVSSSLCPGHTPLVALSPWTLLASPSGGGSCSHVPPGWDPLVPLIAVLFTVSRADPAVVQGPWRAGQSLPHPSSSGAICTFLPVEVLSLS